MKKSIYKYKCRKYISPRRDILNKLYNRITMWAQRIRPSGSLQSRRRFLVLERYVQLSVNTYPRSFPRASRNKNRLTGSFSVPSGNDVAAQRPSIYFPTPALANGAPRRASGRARERRTRNHPLYLLTFSSRSRDQQHRAQQQLDEHRGFGRRSRRFAAPAAAERLQGRRSILSGGQHSSSSRSSSAGHGGADPASRAPTGPLPRASASAAAADSQWIAVHAAQDLDRTEEEEQYVPGSRHVITSSLLFRCLCVRASLSLHPFASLF